MQISMLWFANCVSSLEIYGYKLLKTCGTRDIMFKQSLTWPQAARALLIKTMEITLRIAEIF